MIAAFAVARCIRVASFLTLQRSPSAVPLPSPLTRVSAFPSRQDVSCCRSCIATLAPGNDCRFRFCPFLTPPPACIDIALLCWAIFSSLCSALLHPPSSLFSGLSGSLSSIVCAPLDIVKTRLQVSGSISNNTSAGVVRTLKVSSTASSFFSWF